MKYWKNKQGKVFAVVDEKYFFECHPEEYLRPATYDEHEAYMEEKEEE